ncbi:MAG: hypothetical protein ACKVVT_18750 [Dehalococcoidia bacterium]
MRSLVAFGLIFAILALLFAAVVLRDDRARGALRLIRNAIWVYVAVIFAVAAYRIWQSGGL